MNVTRVVTTSVTEGSSPAGRLIGWVGCQSMVTVGSAWDGLNGGDAWIGLEKPSGLDGFGDGGGARLKLGKEIDGSAVVESQLSPADDDGRCGREGDPKCPQALRREGDGEVVRDRIGGQIDGEIGSAVVVDTVAFIQADGELGGALRDDLEKQVAGLNRAIPGEDASQRTR